MPSGGVRLGAAVIAVLVLGSSRVFPLSSVQMHYAPVRLTGMELAGDGDLRLRIEVDEPMDTWVYAADTADAPEGRPIGKLPATVSGSLLWRDEGAVDKVSTRYYWLLTQGYEDPRPGREEWVLFVQPRDPGQKYLLSVPVDLGDANRLDMQLGDQLACGLHAGASTNTADRLRIMDVAGQWRSYYLLKDEQGGVRWWDPVRDARAHVAIAPGEAFWLERLAGDSAVPGRGVFFGRTWPRHTVGTVFRAGRNVVTPFGVPFSRPLLHRNTETAGRHTTPPNQLGFARVGSGGSTSDHRRSDELGDQIWVWHNNEWAARYWLMDHLGTDWDGRWWNDRTRDFGDFALEPGWGYYYIHPTNRWGGSTFTWRPAFPDG